MKHGVAFRKLSRTSSHRMLMLRNLVTSLFQHEQIKTTLPKARDTARLAEKIITLGKKGDLPAFRRATGFLLDQTMVPKLFSELATRYSDRPGGYTRVHKFGNRPGDNAPHAILELVDNPRDLRFQMTARAIGWELLGKRVGQGDPKALVKTGIPDIVDVIEKEKTVPPEGRGELRSVTRKNLQKVLKFRGVGAVEEMSRIAEDHVDTVLAQPLALKEIVAAKQEKKEKHAAFAGIRLKAGQTLPGGQRSTLHLAQGDLGRENPGRWQWFTRRKLGVDQTSVWNQL
ncbi:mitochondrial ribosomal protein L17 [Trametes versicolor FP-101664 SS1]|uniref:mitochondrial ribosomal protein L17 n=1 Tax=Trametes versicolor (strain FP-101664) TaxID=717944 RepID=UPI0004623158|nr:mitochondrial ribosomal protein L17 [Trametes versicolor FP-101664 SS1]EIW64391.1 mitochondrial ribosomal protein L17 [Trametes versicolor FP-101664 SS1]